MRHEDFNFNWTEVALTPTNCTDLECSIHTLFSQPFNFNFTDPPAVIKGCMDDGTDADYPGRPDNYEGAAENYNPDAGEQIPNFCIYTSEDAGKIVISELSIKPNNSQAAFEYIKLYNNSDEVIDLTSRAGLARPVARMVPNVVIKG